MDGTRSTASPRVTQIKYAHWNKAGGFSGSRLWWRLRRAEEPRKKLLDQLMATDDQRKYQDNHVHSIRRNSLSPVNLFDLKIDSVLYLWIMEVEETELS